MPLTPELLATIGSYESLAKVLRDELSWPEEKWVETRIEDLYGLKDLGNLQSLSAITLEGQQYGIFLADFKDKKLERRALGKALKALAEKARETRPEPTWPVEEILFICRSETNHWTFARYSGTRNKAKLETFGWENPRHSRTVIEHNLKALDWRRQSEWHKAWDVKRVVKDFYSEFDRIFKAHEGKVVLVEGDYKAKRKPMPKGEQRTLFLQRITNRLLFLAFLQKKRWLDVEGHKGDYLFHLYNRWKAKPGSHTFFQVLRVLFFSVLNEPDATKRAKVEGMVGSGPYLNGGLFHMEELEQEGKMLAIPPDELFEDLLGEKGLFRSYNFTAIENYDESDQDVAVDPEMLGKIFEELVTDRHDGGSYYTPRPIVAFMCQEALRGYLEAEGFDKDAVLKLVAERDPGAFGPKDFKPLLEALARVRVVDPACGSGAYLVGMLHEILVLVEVLEHRFEPLKPHDEYKRKLEVIKNSIYGVDLKDFAVNIARLRMWLSLAVEFKGDDPPPLPNLDFKIETGDALLGPAPGKVDQGSILSEQLRQLGEKQDEFLSAGPKRQEDLLEDIRVRTEEIKQELPPGASETAFVWQAEFPHVFRSERQGFDIVIANPPYVRQELIKDIKPALSKVYKEFFSGTADLYTYFYCRGVQLLGEGGMLAFISSNKWFRAAYGKNLREFLAKETSVRSITDFGELPVFETAATFPMIFVAQKGSDGHDTWFTQVKTLEPPYPDVRVLMAQSGFALPPGAIHGADWRLVDAETTARMRKMEANGVPLGEYVKGKIFYGIKTGFNEAFVIDGAKRAELIAEDPKSAEIIKPLAVGDDVRRWRIRERDRWLIVTKIGVDMKRYPAVMKHLKKWEQQLKARQDQGEHWWELRSCAYYADFERPKLVFPDIGKVPRFSFDFDSRFINDTTFMIAVPDLPLLAILNSTCGWDWLKIQCAVIGSEETEGRIRLKRIYVEQFPIPRADKASRDALTSFVEKCLDAKAEDPGADVSGWEAEIDKRVEYLYFHQDEFDSYEAWQEHLKSEEHALEQDTRALIKKGEGPKVEFKQSFEYVDANDAKYKAVPESHRKQKVAEDRKAVTHSALKTIAAFRNSKGGTLLIGVHDNGTIMGIEPDYALCGNKQDWDGFVLKLVDAVKKRISPLYHDIEPQAVRLDGKTVCRIDVEPSKAPHYLDGTLYIRVGNQSEALEGPKLADWLRDR